MRFQCGLEYEYHILIPSVKTTLGNDVMKVFLRFGFPMRNKRIEQPADDRRSLLTLFFHIGIVVINVY